MGSSSSSPLRRFLIVVMLHALLFSPRVFSSPFDQNYGITWGEDHFSRLDNGYKIQLTLDKTSGHNNAADTMRQTSYEQEPPEDGPHSTVTTVIEVGNGAGFDSKLDYIYGFFHMKIKIPNKDSAGVVTAFYLSSNTKNQDELDFEFLGNKEGKPIMLQTNIIMNGQGSREQRFHLWFDPAADFHDYAILWNPYHVVFFVDVTPIRIFEKQAGFDYPSQPMQVMASIWNGEEWATDGGRTKIDWSSAPFIAHFQDFNIDGCAANCPSCASCSSSDWWWNIGRYRELTPAQKVAFERAKEEFMIYDYCSDNKKKHVPSPECP